MNHRQRLVIEYLQEENRYGIRTMWVGQLGHSVYRREPEPEESVEKSVQKQPLLDPAPSGANRVERFDNRSIRGI